MLFQYGGPRLGERTGTSVFSPSAAEQRASQRGWHRVLLRHKPAEIDAEWRLFLVDGDER